MRGNRAFIRLTVLIFTCGFAIGAPAQVMTDKDALRFESDLPEVIIPDDEKGTDIHAEDDSQFDADLPEPSEPGQTRVLPTKRTVDQFNTEACKAIIAAKDHFPKEQISKTTQYFIPLFTPGKSGGLQLADRTACIRVEGSCVVNTWLYNWLDRYSPWGKRYVRAEVPFKFGKGSGKSIYNTTNALDPCRTVAADLSQYPTGSIIYIPSMAGKLCPQTGQAIDGCFVVGDMGGAILGKGRFDLFTGECANYKKSNNTCAETLNQQFQTVKGAEFYFIGRQYNLAKALREEADAHILRDWRLPAP